MPNETISRAPYRELPDPQVRNAADQFHEGFRVLDAMPPRQRVLLPALDAVATAVAANGTLILKSS